MKSTTFLKFFLFICVLATPILAFSKYSTLNRTEQLAAKEKKKAAKKAKKAQKKKAKAAKKAKKQADKAAKERRAGI